MGVKVEYLGDEPYSRTITDTTKQTEYFRKHSVSPAKSGNHCQALKYNRDTENNPKLGNVIERLPIVTNE